MRRSTTADFKPSDGLGINNQKVAKMPPIPLRWIVGLVALVVIVWLAVYCAFQVSPWPSALLIRWQFAKNDEQVAAALQKHVPPGVSQLLDIPYAKQGADTHLDVFYPTALERFGRRLPTVVWVHGGGFVGGAKDGLANYLKIIAAKGYTVVGTNYSVAPGATYPTPITQTMAALRFLKEHAAEYHIDATRFVLAGDSAGAQIASQVTAMTMNPVYAKLVGVKPSLEAREIVGTVLNCGPYDVGMLDFNGNSAGAKFLRTALWAYSGTKSFSNNPIISQISVVNFVTSSFPPTYISGGNADPLTPQGVALADKLKSLGVKVDSLFFAADRAPPLEHEYQFNLDTDAGQEALNRTIAFLAVATKKE